VHEGDIADRRADAGTEDAELGIALLFEPVEAPAGVLDGLAIGLEREADIGAPDLVGAFVAVGHAAVVVGHAHLEDGMPRRLNPVAETVLAVPFGVPIGEEEDQRSLASIPGKSWAWTVLFSGQGIRGNS